MGELVRTPSLRRLLENADGILRPATFSSVLATGQAGIFRLEQLGATCSGDFPLFEAFSMAFSLFSSGVPEVTQYCLYAEMKPPRRWECPYAWAEGIPPF